MPPEDEMSSVATTDTDITRCFAPQTSKQTRTEHEAFPPAFVEVPVTDASGRLAQLQRENDQLRKAQVTGREIGWLTGVLTERYRLTPTQSWELVVRISQQTNLRAAEVARILHDAYEGMLAPADHAAANRLAEVLGRSHIGEITDWKATDQVLTLPDEEEFGGRRSI